MQFVSMSAVSLINAWLASACKWLADWPWPHTDRPQTDIPSDSRPTDRQVDRPTDIPGQIDTDADRCDRQTHTDRQIDNRRRQTDKRNQQTDRRKWLDRHKQTKIDRSQMQTHIDTNRQTQTDRQTADRPIIDRQT